MYPVHKEKYIINKETFYNFTYDRHADIFKKEKRTAVVNGVAMAICAAVTAVLNFVSPAIKGDYVWLVLPFAFVFLCLKFVLQYKNSDKTIATKILKDYQSKKYEDRYVSLKFYEDKMEYALGDNKEIIGYNTFKKFYEGKAYFAIYFSTGELVLMSDKQNVAKIKEIFENYRTNITKNAAETEEMMDTVVETAAADVME